MALPRSAESGRPDAVAATLQPDKVLAPAVMDDTMTMILHNDGHAVIALDDARVGAVSAN